MTEKKIIPFAPATATGGIELPLITVEAGKLHRIATWGEAALIQANVDFYSRGGQVVRPIVDEVDASKGRKTKCARLGAVGEDTMRDYLSRHARWERFDKRSKEPHRCDPPRDPGIILSRDGEWKFRPLAGVITAPTMRPDGSIFSTPGYDQSTRLVLFDPPLMPVLIGNPTRQDALEALALFEELLAEFPFVDEASEAVALSALITPVVRGAMGVAPLHAFRAPAAGSGKSYLVDVASAIETGRLCPVIAAGRTEEETEKRLGAAMLAGYPLISIDNLNGMLGGDCLCQPGREDHRLGQGARVEQALCDRKPLHRVRHGQQYPADRRHHQARHHVFARSKHGASRAAQVPWRSRRHRPRRPRQVHRRRHDNRAGLPRRRHARSGEASRIIRGLVALRPLTTRLAWKG